MGQVHDSYESQTPKFSVLRLVFMLAQMEWDKARVVV